MKREIRTFLNKVKRLLVDVYGENSDYIYIDDPQTLQEFTGHGDGSLGGLRCEAIKPMYDIIIADDFPECPEGYFCEPINSWSFGVYYV
jgi:hypothetical protein